MSKIKTIEHIINTFLELCSIKSFSDISMREVARYSGFSHTLLLKYFPTKSMLLISSYELIMKKSIHVYESANSLGELACYIIDTWGHIQNISATFTKAFEVDINNRKLVYKISRDILFKHVMRLCDGNKSSSEAAYTYIIAISHYPSTMIQNEEVTINMDDYKYFLKKIHH